MHKPTEIENKSINEGREKVQSDLLHDLTDWLQEFRENLVDESSPLEPRGNPKLEDQDTSRSSHEFPMESRAKVEPVRVNTVFILTSLKTEIARSAKGPKLQEPRAQDALAEPYFVQKILVI